MDDSERKWEDLVGGGRRRKCDDKRNTDIDARMKRGGDSVGGGYYTVRHCDE